MKLIIRALIILFAFLPSIITCEVQGAAIGNKIIQKQIFSPDSFLIYSHPAGFYDSSFYLTIKASLATDSILYTLDGSNPFNRNNYFKSGDSLQIFIHPDSIEGRAKTPAVVVKAAIIREGITTQHAFGQTYIFIDQVLEQSHPGGSWPSGSVNNQVLDYEMDDDIINSAEYKNLIKPALYSLPALSISTDMEYLFDDEKGLYVNSWGRGDDWERECTVELIYPDSSEGFTINAGLRMRGGSSRNTENPKHSLRLFFTGDYGATKLNYPLFGDEGVDKYDKIDLRTAQNYSWNTETDEGKHNTLVRDIFSRDLQAKMNQPYSRGRYYHLYLNGMYWGIYQTDERKDATFANAYFGGKKKDYDVIKVSPEHYPYSNELTDGNYTMWRELYRMCNTGFLSNKHYFKLEGKTEEGIQVVGGKVLVDIDNLIDYMIIIFYTGNFDAPTSAFGGNRMPNNYYAIYNRKNKAEGFVFVAHDSEHSMMTVPIYAGQGLYEDRVNIDELEGWLHFDVERFTDFNPQWLHHRLCSNKEYRQRFSDRAAKYFNSNGILSPDSVTALCQTRVKQIETAIIAESARWGDARANEARTKNDDWVVEINTLMDDFFPYRTDIVIDQLVYAKLFNELAAPQYLVNTEEIKTDNYFFEQSLNLKIKLPSGSSGAVYYTTNGEDPREIGGGISADASSSDSDVVLDFEHTTIVNARIKDGNSWGPKRKLTCIAPQVDFSNLKLTEISYHPTDEIIEGDTLSSSDLEFIEFKNTGPDAINLAGLVLDSAVYYKFPTNGIIPPGDFYVLASDSNKFACKYGMYPSGEYKRKLSNSGEFILLQDIAGNKLMSLEYMDDSPWPDETDGEGYTITSTITDPVGDPSDFDYWKNSSLVGGSPFADDTVFTSEIQESIALTGTKVYPTITNDRILIEFINNVDLANASIQLFDHTGRLIGDVENPQQKNVVSLRQLNISAGIYYLRIAGISAIRTEKIVVVD